MVLLRLIHRGVEWAVDSGTKHWPTDRRDQVIVAECALERDLFPGWLEDRLEALIPALGPTELWPIISLLEQCPRRSPTRTSLVAALLGSHRQRTVNASIRLTPEAEHLAPASLSFVPVFGDRHDFPCGLARSGPLHPEWRACTIAAELFQSPNTETLSSILGRLAAAEPLAAYGFVSFFLPWPIAACIAAAQRDWGDLNAFARHAADGAMGSAKQWHAAEERWQKRGVGRADLTYRPEHGLPFDRFVAEKGAPWSWVGASITWTDAPNLLPALVALCREDLPGNTRSRLLWFIIFEAERLGTTQARLDAQSLRGLLTDADGRGLWTENIVDYADEIDARSQWLDFFNWLGGSDALASSYQTSDRDVAWCKAWESAFIRDNSRHGLLRLLGRIAPPFYLCEIPSGMLELASLPDPRVRFAAILLRLSSPTLAESESSDLATSR